ncbi:MAG TPA: polyamine aminopropyltransferase [Clostridiales bacterium]|nr:polyamine aminopropyltransferase [Clostridiales bacterium]
MNNNLYPEYIKKINNELWLTEFEAEGLKFSYKLKEVIYSKQSDFQHIMILDSYDFGKMLVLDGIVQTTARDGHVYNEMISHIPMNIHPHPKRILIIGGGDCGAVREVTKYQCVEQIDFVEIDELVVRACLEYLPEVSGNLSDPRVNFIFQDGIKFVQNIVREEDYYDIVIVDSSDPVGPAIPLFSLDFYKSIYKILRDDGLMVCQSESPVFYIETLKQTYQRLSSVFPITKVYDAVVPTYPGGAWTFTLGSKKYSDPMPWKSNKDTNKDTKYVNDEILEKCFALPKYIKKELKK